MIEDEARRIIEAASGLAGRAGVGEFASWEAAAAIDEGGSDRRFYRLAAGNRTAVLLSQPGGAREIDSYLEIARLLSRFHAGAPEIYASDGTRGLILMEDLGDLHLEDALKTASGEEAAAYYAAALDILVLLETSVTEALAREGLLQDRIFDEKTLLGETEYFMREFIEGFCTVPVAETWEEERRFLAAALAREPLVFMHRDFQCRNIMVKDGRLRIVDFQTAHRGPGLYDTASLLKDPYHPIPAHERHALLEEFHAKLQARGARRGETFDEFHRMFTLAGIQRNLQALAAFVKLGIKRGKPRFLASIPDGINLLEEGIRESRRLPGLQTMVAASRVRISEMREKGLF